ALHRLVPAAGGGWFFAIAFLLITLPTGVRLALVTPLGVIDEPAHAARIESLAAGELFPHRGVDTGPPPWHGMMNAGVSVDPGLLFATEAWNPNMRVKPGDVERTRRATWLHIRVFVPVTPMAAYFPIFYVPWAIAVFGAKLLGAGPHQTFVAARFANLTAFTLLGFIALL